MFIFVVLFNGKGGFPLFVLEMHYPGASSVAEHTRHPPWLVGSVPVGGSSWGKLRMWIELQHFCSIYFMQIKLIDELALWRLLLCLYFCSDLTHFHQGRCVRFVGVLSLLSFSLSWAQMFSNLGRFVGLHLILKLPWPS